ncbi:MAG: tRNA-splicing endonuclease [Candidatus Methanofastidiosum methylothiophilum]|jgi:tRNA-intron endonuclease|uniref:tRNA-splicing endonuclease n=1 Tax=Candidatus Methanofastidiosum methylothiophilum TaxID=1705564 RepID=A0A150JME9_9EURY|nr:MAG: tRNA-splicing endonuclease [Candidatus Methanofastidiosum methylthiophilus]MBP6932952.1 tRNA-intron lyase [Methanofastidiosum sp.]OQC50949.1 MAG: tRNA-splicing endonuclease [Euryarchaeota archaeon ADurb.Bin023]KYC56570.1 MAG: tRNA-splicing endonuclease [Candidatus Methanofastidiosum methylthiophilus]KYC58044.1 MAG: tRNA-splicing endonuclease [Candidatus Methanofastidiosum methylthiophilus]
MFSAILVENRAIIDDKDAVNKIHKKRGFGELIDKKLYLTVVEALYLVERGLIKVTSDNKELSFEELLKNGSGEQNIFGKYVVFKDLKEKGYQVKTAFKYGCAFRIYRGSIEEGHADYIIDVFMEGEKIDANILAAHVRIAHSVKKDMVFAFVDSDNDITYYLVKRMTF